MMTTQASPDPSDSPRDESAGGPSRDERADGPPHHESADEPAPPRPESQEPPVSTHPGIGSQARTWAALTHLSAFVGAWVFLAFVGPLVMWLLKRDEDPFLDHHGREALNFNLTLLVAMVAGALLAIPVVLLTLGLGLVVLVPLAAVIGLTWLVLTVVAAVRASDGEAYRYPLTIRFVR